MKKSENSFSIKEISVILNNALTAVQNPDGQEIKPTRLVCLRKYANALLEPLLPHISGGVDEDTGERYPAFITAEEMTFILMAAAFMVHLSRVAKTDKLPNAEMAKLLFKQ